MSASTLAAGCTMSSSFMMVAPSFEIVTLPCIRKRSPHIILFRAAVSDQSSLEGVLLGTLSKLKAKHRIEGLTLSSCTSLSMPRGPRVVLTVSTTAMQAFMLLISCGVP